MARFNPKELQDNDIIVVGMLKTLGLFNAYFNNSRFDFAAHDTIVYQNRGSSQKFIYKPSGDPNLYHTDYGFMAKFPGPNGNIIYLFGGLWDTGVSQSLKNFTDPKLQRELEKAMKDKFGELPKYYEVLFEVSGVDRMELALVSCHIYFRHSLPATLQDFVKGEPYSFSMIRITNLLRQARPQHHLTFKN